LKDEEEHKISQSPFLQSTDNFGNNNDLSKVHGSERLDDKDLDKSMKAPDQYQRVKSFLVKGSGKIAKALGI